MKIQNIVFFGSSQFAVPSLVALGEAGYKIACVVTQPDRVSGRGLQLTSTVVKKTAEALQLKVYQPQSINLPEAKVFLKALNADLFVVIAYGQILSQEILDTPKILSLNLHASLLPKYRGAAPINWAIIKGETSSGITVIKMTDKMDAGPIILQRKISILSHDTALSLEDKLSVLAQKALLDALAEIKNNQYKLMLQNERGVSFAPKLKKEDGCIDWSKPAEEISCLIRGCLEWPGAFTYYNGKLAKVYKAKVFQFSVFSSQFSVGKVVKVDKDGIVVATGKDSLIIQELQIEGKRVMRAEEFIAGHRIKPGLQFTALF